MFLMRLCKWNTKPERLMAFRNRGIYCFGEIGFLKGCFVCFRSRNLLLFVYVHVVKDGTKLSGRVAKYKGPS